MIMDAQLLLDDSSQHLTTEASQNYIDLGPGTNRNLGVGENLFYVCLVDVAFTDSGSNSTMAVTLETDDASSFGSATTAQTIGTFAALSAIGTRLVARLAPDVITERYLRAKYTVANGDLTTGKFTSFICQDVYLQTHYPDAITFA